jgi:hypothetical protein
MSEQNNELTQTDIIRAATNDPSLATREFTLGDRTFKVVDLKYDDYLTFLSHLQPLLQAVMSTMTGETLDVAQILKHCGAKLPEMVLLMCRQTDPNITIDEIKELGRTPFKMAQTVLVQIEHNRMIQDISDFFEQILPMVKNINR